MNMLPEKREDWRITPYLRTVGFLFYSEAILTIAILLYQGIDKIKSSANRIAAGAKKMIGR